MIGVALTLPGLGETPPSTGGVVKKLLEGGTFAESFEGFGSPRAMGAIEGKQTQIPAKPQASSQEQKPATLTGEPKQATAEGIAPEVTVDPHSLLTPPAQSPSGSSLLAARSKPLLPAAEIPLLPHDAPTPTQVAEVQPAAEEAGVSQQAALLPSSTKLAISKPDWLTPEPPQLSGNRVESRPQAISTKDEAKQDKAKPLEKTAAKSSTSTLNAPSQTLSTLFAPQTPIVAPTICAPPAAAQTPSLATPAPPLPKSAILPAIPVKPVQSAQTPAALNAKTIRDSQVASLPEPIPQAVHASELNPATHRATALPASTVSTVKSVKTGQTTETSPALEAKTIRNGQMGAQPKPTAQPVEAAASNETAQVTKFVPETGVAIVTSVKPVRAILTIPTLEAKTIHNGQAASQLTPTAQATEAAESNPPTQVADAPQASALLIDSVKPLQTSAQSAVPVPHIPVVAPGGPSTIEKKTPAVAANHNAVAQPTQSDPGMRAVSAVDTPPQQGHTRNTPQTEHAFVVEKSSTPDVPTIASSPDIAPLAIKTQETNKAEIIPSATHPSLAMEGLSEAALSTPSLAHTTLHATPTTLEVGVPGGTQGWLKIRAEMGEGGTVQASISSTTKDGHEMLHRDLPAMKAFLDAEQLPVTLQITHASAGSSLPEANRIIADTATIASATTASSQDATGLIGNGQQQTGTPDQPSRQGSSRPDQAHEQETFHRDFDESPQPMTMGFDGSLRGGGGWLNVMA